VSDPPSLVVNARDCKNPTCVRNSDPSTLKYWLGSRYLGILADGYLVEGDVMRCEIEGIGATENPVVDDTPRDTDHVRAAGI
jgi:2-keto-4-pentenoate hydratase/2-oxohepta-3-ene-1,7-dioic acid hydratase in catechol pathway